MEILYGIVDLHRVDGRILSQAGGAATAVGTSAGEIGRTKVCVAGLVFTDNYVPEMEAAADNHRRTNPVSSYHLDRPAACGRQAG